MSQFSKNELPYWLLYFDTLETSNNYAMQRAEDGLAQNGEVIWAGKQTGGRGQRGKAWSVAPYKNLTFSLILKNDLNSSQLFSLNAGVAVTIVKYLQIIAEGLPVSIKWPNDIYIHDKKACGILIENTFRGMLWQSAIIGIGLNVNQSEFPAELTNVTSLALATGKEYDLLEMMIDLRNGLLNTWHNHRDEQEIIREYNSLLFRRNREVSFRHIESGIEFHGTVTEVTPSGELIVETWKGREAFRFGELQWLL